MADALAALPGDAYCTVKRQLRGETIAALREVVDRMLGAWLSDETAQAASPPLGGG